MKTLVEMAHTAFRTTGDYYECIKTRNGDLALFGYYTPEFVSRFTRYQPDVVVICDDSTNRPSDEF